MACFKSFHPQVVTIKLIRDKYSGRSKGMGYIEMGSQ